jgi:hypothetical protein
LAAYCAALLRKTLIQGGAMMGYDLFNYFYPAKQFAADSFWRGELPLWDPYIYFGVPFLANVQMAALYPPDAIFLFLDFPRGVAVSQWLHLCVAAAGMYLLCRLAWGLDALAAALGAVVFCGSGFFAAHMGHLNQVHAGAWLPWVALCAHQLAAARLRSVPWLVAGGAAVALQITAGHTQEAYYTYFALGLGAIGFSLFPPARAAARWSHAPALAAIVANGAFLSAAQLLPAVELSRLSYRQGGMALQEAVAYAVERTYVLETVLPTFWSLPSQEATGYVGVAALILAAIAVAVSAARRLVVTLLALAALALTLTLGAYTPLYYWLYRLVPLFGSFRAPGRWLLIATFAFAALAALGLHAVRFRRCGLSREGAALRVGLALVGASVVLASFVLRTSAVHAVQWLPHARVAVLWTLAAFGAASLALVSLFTPLSSARLALVGVVALELAFAAHEAEYNRPNDPELYLGRPAVASYVAAALGARNEPAETRLLSAAVEQRLDPARLRRAVPDGDPEYLRYASMREALKADLNAVYRLASADGYDGGLLPTRDYARFKELLVSGEAAIPHLTLPPQLNGRAPAALLGALNVRFLLTDGRTGAPGPGWELREGAPGAAWIYENSGYAPRAFLVPEVVVERDPDATWRRLRDVDLTRVAVLDAPPPGPLGQLATTRSARVVGYGPQHVDVAVDPGEAALLLITDSFYPGWRATADGRPVAVLRADGLFRAVPVPAGAQRIRMWFDPLSVKLGIVLSAAALLANGGAIWYARRAAQR